MKYYLKRVGQGIFTIWVVLTVTFAIIRWMPGGPLDFIRSQMISGAIGPGSGGSIQGNPARLEQFNQLAELYVGIEPSEPLHLQYWNYMTGILTGDFGKSIKYSEPVMDVLVPAIPWTVFIGSIAVFISFVTRVVIGGALAYVEGSRFDFGGTSFLVWSHAFPYFIIALLLLFVFSYRLSWFPINGRVNAQATAGLNWPFIAGILHHAALPVISLAWASFGAGAIAMRANAIQVLGEDYVRVARIRGIPTARVTIWYVARNAVLPMYTGMLLAIGFMFGGSVILEYVFRYQGVGWYLFAGIEARDYPLMMGGFLIISIAVVAAMVVADFTYGVIDPRVKRGESDESF